jgi:Domain of unknown function (DUF4349)
MRTHSDDFDLAAELQALRPAPRTEFTAELDSRAAGGFGKAGHARSSAFARLAQAVRRVPPRRLAGLAGAAALLAIAVSTALISTSDLGGGSGPRQVSGSGEPRHNGSHEFSGTPKAASEEPPSQSSLSGGASAPAEGAPQAGYQYSAAPPTTTGAPPVGGHHRKVERGAELVLRSEPGEIETDARKVFAAVRAARGVVLDSSVHDWKANAGSHAGEARASFELLLPSARLGDTMAALSRIAPVRSRHESTLDITGPTVTVRDRLRSSEAKVESLLAQLATAASDEERLAAEAELRRERRSASALRSRLDRLHGRAHYSHVTMRIEGRSTADSGSTSWGVDDALGDAGRILAVAAGVVVIGLAVIAPLAILTVLGWLTGRAWRRRSRERALG